MRDAIFCYAAMRGHVQVRALNSRQVGRAPTIGQGELLHELLVVLQQGCSVPTDDEVNIGPEWIRQTLAYQDNPWRFLASLFQMGTEMADTVRANDSRRCPEDRALGATEIRGSQ